jgi:hypothetical protein
MNFWALAARVHTLNCAVVSMVSGKRCEAVLLLQLGKCQRVGGSAEIISHVRTRVKRTDIAYLLLGPFYS